MMEYKIGPSGQGKLVDTGPEIDPIIKKDLETSLNNYQSEVLRLEKIKYEDLSKDELRLLSEHKLNIKEIEELLGL